MSNHSGNGLVSVGRRTLIDEAVTAGAVPETDTTKIAGQAPGRVMRNS